MDFIYETLPIFLCGFAAGIVLTALVGWVIKEDFGGTEINGAQEPSVEDKAKERPFNKFPLSVRATKEKGPKKNKTGVYAVI